jgi:signal transduction histidine kinase
MNPRIFGGLLALARDANQNGAQGNLRRALDSTLAVLRSRFDRQGIRLEVQLGDVVPNIPVGQADLERVLLNLATNAGEAMPKGGLLSIKAENAGDRLAVLITDTGLGITPENLTRIEEPFFTTKHNGTGLGLSVCRSILRNAGGQLYIYSQPGSTKVTVLLPVAAEKAAPHE